MNGLLENKREDGIKEGRKRGRKGNMEEGKEGGSLQSRGGY